MKLKIPIILAEIKKRQPINNGMEAIKFKEFFNKIKSESSINTPTEDKDSRPDDEITSNFPDMELGNDEPANNVEDKEDEKEENPLKNIPFKEKLNIVFKLLGELGVTEYEYKMQEGKNYIKIYHNIEKADQETIEKACEEIGLTTEIEDISLGDNEKVIKLSLKNKVSLENFFSNVKA